MLKNFLKVSFYVSSILLLGRLAGFFREVLIARRFGVSADADIVVLIGLVPDFFTSIILGTALTGSFIPSYNRLKTNDQKILFFRNVSTCTVIFGLFLWSICAAFAPLLMTVFAGSLSEVDRLYTKVLLIVSSIAIPVILLTGVFNAHLQAQLKQISSSFSTFIFNVCLVFSLLVFVRSPKHWAFALIFAALVRLFWVWMNDRLGWKWWGLKDVANMRTFFQSYMVVWTASALFLTLLPLLAKAAASQINEGELAIFNYAMKLIELPNAVFISVLGVVLLPQLSSIRDNSQSGKLTADILNISFFLSLILCFLGASFSHQYSSLVFGFFGKLSYDEVTAVANVVFIGLFVLPFQAIIYVGSAYLLSESKAYLMLKINAAVILFFCFLVYMANVYSYFNRSIIVFIWVLTNCMSCLFMIWLLKKYAVITHFNIFLWVLTYFGLILFLNN